MKIRYWRRRYFGENTSLIVASVAIGISAAFGAVALKLGVSELTRLLHRWLFGSNRSLLVLVYPHGGHPGDDEGRDQRRDQGRR